MLALLALGASGCSRRVTGAPIDLDRPTSAEILQELVRDHAARMDKLEEEYRIGPGDVVTIQLRGHPEILGEAQNGPQGGFTVLESPTLFLPYIGEIRVHGRTAEELREDLRAAFAEYVRSPDPVVIVREFKNNQFAVLGNVPNPGKYPLERGDVLQDAIFKAGGISGFGRGGQAPGRYLKLYREKVGREERASLSLDELIARFNQGDRLLPRDEYTVPIEDFIITGAMRFNIPMLPNDILYVPAAGSVIVYGRATQPGVVFLGPSVRTVAQVLTEAGGLRLGAKSRIEIVRRNPEGERQTFAVNARKILTRRELDFMLMDGDEIWVYDEWWRVGMELLNDMIRRGTRAGVSATYNPVMGGFRP